jgi:hypothetical protein
MKKHNLIFLMGIMVLSRCNTTDSSVISAPSEDLLTSNIPTTSDFLTSEQPVTSDITSIYNPEIPGLTYSQLWPTEALNAYLIYAENIDMPTFVAAAGFYHGVYDSVELGEYYRVVVRVASASEFDTYKNTLMNDFDFTVEEVEGLTGLFYGESQYDDVRLYFEYTQSGSIKEITFDFFDGSGDDYRGPVAENGLAYFDLKTEVALASKSSTRAKWEVRPATFMVYKNTSGYNVGNTNGEQLSNPLRIYPGQSAKFNVPANYYIVEIKLLTASGYAGETVDNGEFINATATYAVDFVTIKPIDQPSEIEYKLAQVQYVGQVRWLDIRLSLAKRSSNNLD